MPLKSLAAWPNPVLYLPTRASSVCTLYHQVLVLGRERGAYSTYAPSASPWMFWRKKGDLGVGFERRELVVADVYCLYASVGHKSAVGALRLIMLLGANS